MSENPFEAIKKTLDSFSRCVQTHFSHLVSPLHNNPQNPHSKATTAKPLILSSKPSFRDEVPKAGIPLTKEELGRSTWTLLHTIAAQYPDHPTRQQKRDVKELMAILSRIYPCKECANHFSEILRANPVQARSQAELSQWLCYVHNIVNRSLGKLTFPCERVNARWGKLDCKDRECDLQGTSDFLTGHKSWFLGME